MMLVTVMVMTMMMMIIYYIVIHTRVLLVFNLHSTVLTDKVMQVKRSKPVFFGGFCLLAYDNDVTQSCTMA